MKLLKPTGDFFALNVSPDAVYAVQLKGSKKALARFGSIKIDKRIARSDAMADKKQLTQSIAKLINDSGITTKNVVVGVPADKSYITVVDLPKLEEKEMNKSIEYQADQFVPIPKDEAKIDWAILGTSPKAPDLEEVLIASVANEYAESRLDLLESIGLNVIAMEPEQFGLVRALIPPNSTEAVIVLDMSETSTNLVAVHNGLPKLIRSIPTGSEAIVRAASQNLSVDESQAINFVYKFGLIEGKLEGQVKLAINDIVDSLIDEVTKSVKFFNNRYKDTNISKLVVTGNLAILPEFPLYLVNKAQIPVEIGNAWLNVNYPQEMANDLASVSHQYSVAVGLAERHS